MSFEQPSLLCEAEKLATPEFLETNDFFDVKLYRPVIEYGSGEISGAIDHSSGAIEDLGGAIEASQLTKRQQEILVLIQRNPKVSYRSLAEKLGINQSALQKHLKHLKDAGWLERMDGTRGYWTIKKEFGGVV
ncbi:hypothetical protein F938_01823 [Acinetobacter bereziniae LMG 1003 = CIP 70.12]|uniref:Uncharacterized protein n=2 Tax=Acinetobacter TaxID=469 RepID=N9ERJ4_ACIBZ|nr:MULTISPECIES: winged helix-turn-helix transcriptional regulator [Acinetobacter]ENV97494.1 hypothetical protein F938_01823 [Acinetobacter bereziniae LMG 1003 = CIP 70.12]OEY92390.1 LexA family transcriptional regulator [Acinetobacter proteolyticus]WEI19890.1 winged helix-turn-helix transcriptional regulator [Acinetobacter proteolyticus]VXA55991.1 LexA family transcriptional regulator [Acinetobacter proteolyticus]